ncbi:MAG: hydrogenase expression/formation protein HypE [Deferribacterales bacterium]|nr:hydrogenase expression/formation protein HypE [Deferribacterales bacterium]
MTDNLVSLSLGGGGKQTSDFIKNIILKNFSNDIIASMGDAARIYGAADMAFTTDSFVVKPDFFEGGNIGKLAVCGTVNDLAVSGAKAEYLSFAIVVAEGYPLDKLEQIIKSAAETANIAGVKIVCGDTKVVERGSLDGVILNTAGVGRIIRPLNDYSAVSVGDKVIVTSDIARHGISVMLARGELGFSGAIPSDCAPLNKMLENIYAFDVKFARDATRGGLAAVLNEISEKSGLGFIINETDIPLRSDVAELCEVLGLDPLSVANEGAAVLVVSQGDCSKVLDNLRQNPFGKNAAVIGSVSESGRVALKTEIGGTRYVDMPPGELLPRIC